MTPTTDRPISDWTDAQWRDLCDPDARVVYVPVRHHSPLCARVVRELIQRRPSRVLVEGPSDFNPRMASLSAAHRLPIAIYTWVESGGSRSGAYYPFCDQSPEWQAVLCAQEIGVPVCFIDQPWGEQLWHDASWNRYADGELRHTPYIETLLERRHLKDFDELWDELFEVRRGMETTEYLRRMHTFCVHMRLSRPASDGDQHRERFMAARIQEALAETEGPILVVTGGFHSAALKARLEGLPWDEPADTALPPVEPAPPGEAQPGEPPTDVNHGITLTPYTDELLDSLHGYESGMPNPGFYNRVWCDEAAGETASGSWRHMLYECAAELRKRRQTVNTADLIAVEGMALSLATMRGHEVPWRLDLIDGVIAALVKDEFSLQQTHPFLDAVYRVLRGNRIGELAEGTELPPLAQEIFAALKADDLMPPKSREPLSVHLDLMLPLDRRKSRLLHRLATLGITGIVLGRRPTSADAETFGETWQLSWSPAFVADCIVCCRYGIDLQGAATAKLLELAEPESLHAGDAARLLLSAAGCGLMERLGSLRSRLMTLLRGEMAIMVLLEALAQLVYLLRHAQIYEAHDLKALKAYVTAAWEQSLCVLETGLPTAEEREAWLRGVGLIVRLCLEWGDAEALDRDALTATMRRLQDMSQMDPEPRGAATGALWVLDRADVEELMVNMRRFADPSMLGRYLSGLFRLARLSVSRHGEILAGIDREVASWDRPTFLTALPGLRLAFSIFAPRERLQIADRVAGLHGITDPLPDWQVSPEEVAAAMHLEAAVAAIAGQLGLRLSRELQLLHGEESV